ncbi:UNKNOWN [Stylonychia lemnae]|uniref:Uncharacterized protein n=1 Tax=Stylonychia lemnae TaxID=5949 RepID=A0A078AU36_STYLE|nr:UNKNOWN [Stylonychia lemnae]|eukprot:CDW84747.1 UNKNOWN [Stylonychia lemnae]
MLEIVQGGLGLHNLWIFWYFIYLWGSALSSFFAFWTGLFAGFDGDDWVSEYESALNHYKDIIINDFLY